jgi:hypothetical protein
MDPHDENERPDSLSEDPVLGASFVAEMERVVGPLDGSAGTVNFQWLLPVTGFAEVLDVLRDAPSGLGVPGLERLLRDRFGTLSALERVDADAGEQGV